jgi:hypothetical protein
MDYERCLRVGSRNALLLHLLAACSGSGTSGSGNVAATRQSCEADLDRSLERIAECRTVSVSDEERERAIEQCLSTDPAINPALFWLPEFTNMFEECRGALSCEEFVEDSDDICFPTILANLAGDLLSPETSAACLLGGSDDCRASLLSHPETHSNAAAACFRKWSECGKIPGNPPRYFTEDYCGTILALVDGARVRAQACLTEPCAETADCLATAGAFNF